MYERSAKRDWRNNELMEKILSAVIARLPLAPGVYRFRDAADFTANGWSGGVLTSFVVRRGQVREWAQACCPESDAAARLADV